MIWIKDGIPVERPTSLPGTSAPTDEQLETAGYVQVQEPACLRKYWHIHGNAVREMTAEEKQQVDAAEGAARDAALAALINSIPESVWEAANGYREVLSLHFGAGAEMNRAITPDVVRLYFISRKRNGAAAPEDASDVLLLREVHPLLEMYSIDGTAWGFPWAALHARHAN